VAPRQRPDQDLRGSGGGLRAHRQRLAGGTLNIRPVKPQTIAKSLAIGNPADGYYALRVMQDTGGSAVASSDEEVVEGSSSWRRARASSLRRRAAS